MSQRNVGYVIDRLLMDPDTRLQFTVDRFIAIAELHLLGLALTPAEIDAFLQSDARCWFLEKECVPGRLH
jgi:hypothetical protein